MPKEEKNLFGEEVPNPKPEIGEDDFRDAEGNVFYGDGRLKKLAPSDGLKMARKQYPGRSDQELAPLARIYNAQMHAEKNKKKHDKID